MERVEAFEKMLSDIQARAEYEKAEMDKMKAAEKKKPRLTVSISEII